MNKKEFDAVKFMQEQRNTLSEKLSIMSKPEIVEYFKRRKPLTTKATMVTYTQTT